jgi:hypothetical protein
MSPRGLLVRLAHLLNHCFRLSHFPNPCKKQGRWPNRDSVRTQNFLTICVRLAFFATTGQFFFKVIPKTVQRHSEERNLLTASQFGCRAGQSTTLQCVGLMDHVTVNLHNKMSTATLSLDIEKAFDIIWHPGLLHKLSKLQFSTSLIKVISLFVKNKNWKFRFKKKYLREDKYLQGCHRVQSYILILTYSLFITDEAMAQVPSGPVSRWHVYISHRTKREPCSQKTAARRTVVWALEHKSQWGENWAIYFSSRRRPVEAHLTLNGQNIPFVNEVKYLDVISDGNITWGLVAYRSAICVWFSKCSTFMIWSRHYAGSKQKSDKIITI